jgi:hypothetical protein
MALQFLVNLSIFQNCHPLYSISSSSCNCLLPLCNSLLGLLAVCNITELASCWCILTIWYSGSASPKTFQTKFYMSIFLLQMNLTLDSNHHIHTIWWAHITYILTKLKQVSSKSREDMKTHFVRIGAPVVLWYRTGIGTPHTLWRDIHQYGRRSSCAINPPPLLVLPP